MPSNNQQPMPVAIDSQIFNGLKSKSVRFPERNYYLNLSILATNPPPPASSIVNFSPFEILKFLI